jgi:hypothetical protein
MPILSVSRLHAAIASAPLALASWCAHADCIADAASRHQVNADVLRAIGWQESRLQPAALGRNGNGSIDVGAFQINSVHLSELGRYGIGASALADGCVSAEVAAWLYRRQVDRDGDSWQAVGAYHSRRAALAASYANQIAAILMRWRVMPAGGLPFPAEQAQASGRPPAPSPAVLPRAVASPFAAPASPASEHAIGYGEIDYRPSPR